MSKPIKFPEKILAQFRPGTIDRIDRFVDNYGRPALIREAVEEKLARLEHEGQGGSDPV